MSDRSIWIYIVPVLGIMVIGIGLYLAWSTYRPSGTPAPDRLVMLADQTVQNPVETPDIEHESGVIGRFQRRTGVRMQVEYGSPEALIDEVSLTESGDLLLVDEHHMEEAVQAGIADHVQTVARLVPVILVERGNPHQITDLPDLFHRDIRLAVADEQTSVMGRVTSEILQKNGISWYGAGQSSDSRPDAERSSDSRSDAEHTSEVRSVTEQTSGSWPEWEQTPLVTDSGYEAAVAVNSRRADAAIIWKHDSGGFSRRTGIIEIPEDQNVLTRVKIAVLTSSQNRDQARRFADFATSRAALELFETYGFDVDGEY